MNTLKQKFKSRKLWAAIAGVLIGIATIFGLDQNVVNTVAGAVTAVVSLATYIIAEGKIDVARLQNTVDSVKDAVDNVREPEAE